MWAEVMNRNLSKMLMLQTITRAVKEVTEVVQRSEVWPVVGSMI